MRELIEKELRAMERETQATNANKVKFVYEIKSGLGETIKENLNDVVIKKPSFFKKLKQKIINIFIRI